MYVHKIPQPPPLNTHFLGLNLKVGEINCRLVNQDSKDVYHVLLQL